MYSRARPVPDAYRPKEIHRQTDKTNKQTRQDRSRLDQVLQVPVTVPVPAPVSITVVPFPLVCDAEQSAFLTEYDMVGVSYLKLKLPPTCQYVPSDFCVLYPYQTTKQASKQAINRFFRCHRSASTGLVSMYCMYVQDMCVCVNSCILVNIPNKHPIRPADRRRTGCFVCWLPGRLG